MSLLQRGHCNDSCDNDRNGTVARDGEYSNIWHLQQRPQAAGYTDWLAAILVAKEIHSDVAQRQSTALLMPGAVVRVHPSEPATVWPNGEGNALQKRILGFDSLHCLRGGVL